MKAPKPMEAVPAACDWFTQTDSRPGQAISSGASLKGRYTVGRVLGQSDLAFTYAAYDRQARRAVAVREFFPAGAAERAGEGLAVSPPDMEAGARLISGADAFYEEAGALMGVVGCTNVAGVRERFFENGTAYAVRDLYEGMTLKEYLRLSRRFLLPGELAYLIKGVSDGLLVVHSLLRAHGGVAMEHIFLTNEGVPVLMGFRGAAVDGAAHTPQGDLEDLGRTLLAAWGGEKRGMASLPETFLPLFTGLIGPDPSRRFESVFQLMHMVNALDAVPLRPEANDALWQTYRREEERLRKQRKRTLALLAATACAVLALTGALIALLVRR